MAAPGPASMPLTGSALRAHARLVWIAQALTASVFLLLAAACSPSTSDEAGQASDDAGAIIQAQNGDTPAAPSAVDVGTDDGNWSLQCAEGQVGARRCRIVTNIFMQETRQRLLSVFIRKPEAETAYRLILALPHGLDLTAGAGMQIDDGAVQSLTIRTSDANGAYAPTELTDDLIDKLSVGAVLNVSFVSSSGQTIKVPVSLSGFEPALNELNSMQQ